MSSLARESELKILVFHQSEPRQLMRIVCFSNQRVDNDFEAVDENDDDSS